MPYSICLNMIVKNEMKVIERCLDSVKGIIDYWVIVDTGSTDGTQDLIRETLKEIPGELHERPWVNFGHNREEALKLAKDKADYLFFIDADETLQFPHGVKKPELGQDFYIFSIVDPHDKQQYTKMGLIKAELPWAWEGVIHEQLTCARQALGSFLQDMQYLRDTWSSHRSQDPQKYQRDASLLEEALKKEPDNARNVFYLAQSYNNIREYALALKNYEKRAVMGGWDQEVFWSLLMVGKLKEIQKYPAEDIIKAYCDAYHYRPNRIEPLFHLANHFIHKENFILAYLIAKYAITIPVPFEAGFVEYPIYDYCFEFLLANAALRLNKIDEALEIYRKLAPKETLNPDHKKVILERLAFCEKTLLAANQLAFSQG